MAGLKHTITATINHPDPARGYARMEYSVHPGGDVTIRNTDVGGVAHTFPKDSPEARAVTEGLTLFLAIMIGVRPPAHPNGGTHAIDVVQN